MTLPACTICAAPAMAIQPGQDELRGPGGILLDAGQPGRGWCAAHYPHRYAALGPLGVAAGHRIGADRTTSPLPPRAAASAHQQTGEH